MTILFPAALAGRPPSCPSPMKMVLPLLALLVLSAGIGHGQGYEILARYDFDTPEDMDEWELEGLGADDATASWDGSLGSPEPGSARFEVGGLPFGRAYAALGPCLPAFPLGQGYTTRIVGQRRTEERVGGGWGQCDMSFGAYEEESVCEGWPDAWTTLPPAGANPWYPGSFLPYEYDILQSDTRFLRQRPMLRISGRIGATCWFDSIEVQLIPPPVTIPTLSPVALLWLVLAMAVFGVWAMRR